MEIVFLAFLRIFALEEIYFNSRIKKLNKTPVHVCFLFEKFVYALIIKEGNEKKMVEIIRFCSRIDGLKYLTFSSYIGETTIILEIGSSSKEKIESQFPTREIEMKNSSKKSPIFQFSVQKSNSKTEEKASLAIIFSNFKSEERNFAAFLKNNSKENIQFGISLPYFKKYTNFLENSFFVLKGKNSKEISEFYDSMALGSFQNSNSIAFSPLLYLKSSEILFFKRNSILPSFELVKLLSTYARTSQRKGK